MHLNNKSTNWKFAEPSSAAEYMGGSAGTPDITDWSILCPKCGCENVHLGGVSVLQKDREIRCCENRTSRIPERNKFGGSRVVVRMFCEAGCEVEYTYQFHEGITYVSMATRTKERDPEHGGPVRDPFHPDNLKFNELWRD